MREIRSRYDLGNLKPRVVQGTGNPIKIGGLDAAQRTIADLGAGHAKARSDRKSLLERHGPLQDDGLEVDHGHATESDVGHCHARLLVAIRDGLRVLTAVG